MSLRQLPKNIEFNRPTRYTVIKRLGEGACGETVLLHDAIMDCNFVAKKYSPIFEQRDSPEQFNGLLERFKHEARLLFQLNHINVVRVYNFFDYSEFNTSYIIMEYVNGSTITDFAKMHPAMLDGIFEKTIDGFTHLEEKNILHRDIRPMNILVEDNGNPKIIDFGFGKKLSEDINDGPKSITLNWWCEIPPEFSRDIYDFQTELYFVGKLFEQIVIEENIVNFKYKSLVESMCEPNRAKRCTSFSSVRNVISTGQFKELSFSHREQDTYRKFADSLHDILSTIDTTTKYEREPDKVIASLKSVYRQSMLEVNVPLPNNIASAIIKGSFSYWTNRSFKTIILKDFLSMLKGLAPDKQNIVLENLIAKLETVDRPKFVRDLDDDIPF